MIAYRRLMHVPRAQLRSVGTAFLRQRPWIVAPAMVLSIGSLALSPAPRAQVVLLSCAMGVVLGWFSWEAVQARRAEFDERYLFRSLLSTLFAIAIACIGTGAIRSPLVPFLFAPTVIGFAAFGRARPSTAMFVCFLAVAAALVAVPVGVPFPPIVAPYNVPMAAGALLGAAALLRVGVAGLTDAYGRAASDLDVAREAVLVGAEARSRALDALGAKVAHEVKNPLASVRGLVELVASESEGRTEERLSVALAEIERIEAILRDYLSFAKPLDELRPVPCDLLELAEEVRAIVDGRAERAGIAVSVEGRSRVVPADPSRLKEALLNLVGNALEATPRGGRVVLEIHEVNAELRVRDTGRGMSSEQLARIGTPGFTTREGGTGLGVVLARAAIAQHGGNLEFESQVGRGTVAIVRIPG